MQESANPLILARPEIRRTTQRTALGALNAR